MTLLHDAVKDKKFDTRMIERNIARGVVTWEDAQKAASSLPDDAENADYVSVDSLANEESGSDNGSTH